MIRIVRSPRMKGREKPNNERGEKYDEGVIHSNINNTMTTTASSSSRPAQITFSLIWPLAVQILLIFYIKSGSTSSGCAGEPHR